MAYLVLLYGMGLRWSFGFIFDLRVGRLGGRERGVMGWARGGSGRWMVRHRTQWPLDPRKKRRKKLPPHATHNIF